MSMSGRIDGVSKAKRRVGAYMLICVVAILGYTVLYQLGMAMLENIRVGFVEALLVVVESFTTTGYGEDAAKWSTNGMWLLVIGMQLTGVALIFLALPLFLVPLFEEAIRTDPPKTTDLAGHVIICTFSARGDVLVDELESMSMPYVVLEPDRETARRLYQDGYSVVHGDPESVEDLLAAGAGDAVALVADADDETNASIVLSATQASSGLRVITLIENADLSDYHRYAGADSVVSPRRLLGRSLARKVTAGLSADIGDAVEIGEDFEIVELLVQQGSQIEGKTIASSGIGQSTGANVIGAWFRGEFVSPPRPDDVIDEHTILLVVGRESQLERFRELTRSEARRYRRGTVIIAGYGEVGSAVTDELATADLPVVVVDEQDKPGVDVVGDITDQQMLEAAGIEDVRSVILALDEDTTTIFATLAIKQMAPDAEVIARANETESVGKLYRAGAEYVLALATVSGRMLASNLLDEEVISPQTQIELVRTHAPNLVGMTLTEADVRARTNCTVIAAERDGALLTEIGPNFTVEDGDELVVVGSDADINRFNELAG
ncbi:MAG: potassium channel family protein [Halobacteriota archaeon]